MLRAVEKKILSYLRTPYRGFYVDLGPAIGEADKVWTLSLNTESKEIPLVMLHGLGAGVALWVMNLDSLAANRPVYAIDILGFGRSSRPKFSTDALTCEKQFVKSVEEWRRETNINQMILMGHSMGGFIASSYTLSYPERVKHLILADPWGFPEKPSDSGNSKQIPLWLRALAYALTPLNPLWALRAAGPLGQWVIEKTRPDIIRKFSIGIGQDSHLIPQYIHQCNAQTPTGETAFHTMMETFGWAKHPMIHRINDIHEDIPITFIYGSRSWIDSSPGEKIKSQRINSLVEINIVNGAGHHVYADKPEVFNRYVNESCSHHNISKLPSTKTPSSAPTSTTPTTATVLHKGNELQFSSAESSLTNVITNSELERGKGGLNFSVDSSVLAIVGNGEEDNVVFVADDANSVENCKLQMLNELERNIQLERRIQRELLEELQKKESRNGSIKFREEDNNSSLSTLNSVNRSDNKPSSMSTLNSLSNDHQFRGDKDDDSNLYTLYSHTAQGRPFRGDVTSLQSSTSAYSNVPDNDDSYDHNDESNIAIPPSHIHSSMETKDTNSKAESAAMGPTK